MLTWETVWRNMAPDTRADFTRVSVHGSCWLYHTDLIGFTWPLDPRLSQPLPRKMGLNGCRWKIKQCTYFHDIWMPFKVSFLHLLKGDLSVGRPKYDQAAWSPGLDSSRHGPGDVCRQRSHTHTARPQASHTQADRHTH